MTLCAAWIRQANEVEELVFATDSMLSGGAEKWEHGVKLFELPIDSGLLCFTGYTQRAYTLILNLISALELDGFISSSSATVADAVEFITATFDTLLETLKSEVQGSGSSNDELFSEARFIFGGWDWKKGKFRVWKLFYSIDSKRFLHNEVTDDDSKTRFYIFIGEARVPGNDFDAHVKKGFDSYLLDHDKLHSKLNMEPVQYLASVVQNPSIQEVGGSLQIAKAYKSSRTEFFGIFWPSSNSTPYFQGRKYNQMTKPSVRYFNPDTFEIMDMDLPDKICLADEAAYGVHIDFVRECYPNGVVNDAISERDRYRIKNILKEVAYRQFMERQQQDAGEEQVP